MNKIISFLSFWLLLNVNAQTETSGRGIYRATSTKHTELIHTKLSVSFNFDNQTLNGEEWLTATPFFYPSDSLVLDAKSMLIHEVKLDKKGKRQKLDYQYQNDFLKIKLDKVYQKGENYTIYIRYTAQPELVKAEGSSAINDAKGLYFINPKGENPDVPTQVWTQGETESSSVWFPTIDKPNQKTTQEIYITVPDKFVTLSNGELKSSENKPNNLRTDYWVMNQKHAPYLFFMGIGDFTIVKDTPWREKVAVDYYVEKEFEAVAKKIFGHTTEMIEFFSKKFNYDYPWQKYAQMVVRDFVSGAMENTTAVSHSESAQQTSNALADFNQWESVIAHELVHHWFGNLVTTESWANLTVNESFATYGEYLWIEYKYGKDAADYHLFNSVNQYRHRSDDFLKKLVRFGYDDKEDMFDLVSYNKGGAILHMLRDYLGDDAFFGGISDYLNTYEFGTGEAHQLRLSFEKISGRDLNWFFNQWFFGYGNPVIKIKTDYNPENKQVTVLVNQTQDEEILFEFPLEIDIYQNGKYDRHSVWVTAQKKNEFTFSSNKIPDLVNVNPRGVILLTQEGLYKTETEYVFQYKNSKDFFSRNEAVEYATEYQYKNILMLATKDSFFRIREKALEVLKKVELSSNEFSEIEKIAKKDPENIVRAAAISILAETENEAYLPIFEKGMTISSNAVRNASLYGISKINPEMAKKILFDANPNDFDADQLLPLVSMIVENKMEKYLETLLPNFMFYPFVSGQSIKQAETLRKGYLWAMSLDNNRLLNIFEKSLKQIEPYLSNPNVKPAIIFMIDEAILTKKQIPQTESVKQQIRQLEEIKNRIW